MWTPCRRKEPLTSARNSDNQHLAFSPGVSSHQVIVACYINMTPQRRSSAKQTETNNACVFAWSHNGENTDGRLKTRY